MLVEASPPPGYKHTRRQVVATLWARVQRTGHAATVPLGACERVLEGTLPHLHLLKLTSSEANQLSLP